MALIELNKQAKKEHKLSPLIGESLPNYIKDYEFVGSRMICNPPPQDTDLDILCLIEGGCWHDFVDQVYDEGWKDGGSELGDDFVSFKKKGSDVNIIATRSWAFYKKFVNAAYLCKKLNLLKKEDRIAVHEAIIDGVVDGMPKKKEEGKAWIPGAWQAVGDGDVVPAPAPHPWPKPEPVGHVYGNNHQWAVHDDVLNVAQEELQVLDALMKAYDEWNKPVPIVPAEAPAKPQAEAIKMNQLKQKVLKKKAFWL